MVTDRLDQIVTELRRLRRQMAGDSNDRRAPELDLYQGMQSLGPGEYVIRETADLDDANSDGTLTLEPGEQEPIVKLENNNNGVACLAIGALDESDVEYYLRIDGKYPVGGSHSSPLGTVNSPFSFMDELNAVIPAERKIEYIAAYDQNATGDVDLSARIHGVVE